jgi:cardiolipin synthase
MNSKRYIYTKACWLFVIILLPLVGCFLFVVFGSLPMKRKDWKEHVLSQTKFNKYEDYEFSKQHFSTHKDNFDIYRYSYHNELKPIYQSNNIQIIDSNTILLENMIRLIRSAKNFIHLETFIAHDGFFFRTITAELIKKVKSGVKVRFIYD